jgi:carbon catabolite-derepressing protein kinase
VGCIYRALKRLGAEWVVQDESPANSDSESESVSGEGDEDEEEVERGERVYSDSSDAEGVGNRHVEHPRRRRRKEKPQRSPTDPWIIQARWKKYAPTRKAEEPAPPEGGVEKLTDSVYVHLTIQLYQLEHDNYLVDFKCAGYERLEEEEEAEAEADEEPKGEGGARKRVGFQEVLEGDVCEGAGARLKKGTTSEGRAAKEDYKDVNSPFPFLDAAGALIIALADAAD